MPVMAAPGAAATASQLLCWRSLRVVPFLRCAQRTFASQTSGELKVTQILKEKFPQAATIKVTDISGGCGSMYEIHIESEEFKDKRILQQHQMVNKLASHPVAEIRGLPLPKEGSPELNAVPHALKEEIKEMHGLRIFTSVPKH